MSISQNELLKLVIPWDVNYIPEYRRFVCAKCGCEMDMAWHIHFVEHGYKREIHLCNKCGIHYGYFVDKKTLVVVATHNGKKYLEKLLPTIEYNYVVIDTGSDEQESIDYFNNLECEKVRIPGGYCVAAYEYAYRHYDFEEYFFMHDSMIVKKNNFIEDFRAKGEVVAWLKFTLAPEHGRDYMARIPGDPNNVPPNAIFGPLFYANRNVMKTIEEKGLFPPHPTCRGEQVACESGYAICFHRAGFPIGYVEEMDNERIDVRRDYILFDKLRPNRE
jgi:hypothetical protein